MAILYPASLANLVVEVGTRHCHQTLLALLSWRFGRDSGELVAGSGELAVGSGEMVSGEMAEWRNDL